MAWVREEDAEQQTSLLVAKLTHSPRKSAADFFSMQAWKDVALMLPPAVFACACVAAGLTLESDSLFFLGVGVLVVMAVALSMALVAFSMEAVVGVERALMEAVVGMERALTEAGSHLGGHLLRGAHAVARLWRTWRRRLPEEDDEVEALEEGRFSHSTDRTPRRRSV